MQQITKKEINLGLTVETTLYNAKGWSFGRYPSATVPNSCIQIDARYSGERGTSSNSGATLKTSRLDYSSKPVHLTIQRGKSIITLAQNTYHDNSKKKLTSYVLTIHTHSGMNYRAIETPDGTFKEQGNPLLLFAVQKDKEFSSYINFVNKGENFRKKHLSQWDLTKIMTSSRQAGM